MRIILAVLVLVTLSWQSLTLAATPSRQQHCIAVDSIPLTRPAAGTAPIEVSVALFVLDIERLSDINQQFNMDFVISLKWKDVRLVKSVTKSSEYICRYPLQSVWHPYLFVINMRKFDKKFADEVQVKKDGTVVYAQRGYGSFTSPLNLRLFPFDSQTLPIKIVLTEAGPTYIKLVFNAADTGHAEKFSIANWQVGSGKAKIGTFSAASAHIPGVAKKFPYLEYSFTAHRSINYYIWKVIAPMVLIVFMSWAVFWINPIKIEVQIALSATTILTLVAFLFSLNRILPQISYLTLMDFFIYSCLILVFAAFVEATITCTMALNGKVKTAKLLDRLSRIIFPSIFFTVLIAFIVLKQIG